MISKKLILLAGSALTLLAGPSVAQSTADDQRTATAAAPDRTKPSLTRARLAEATLRLPRRGGLRARLQVSLSERAVLQMQLQRKVRDGFEPDGGLTHLAKPGANDLALTLSRKGLRRGRYRLVVVAVDPAGNRSSAKRLALTLR
jgi:hypothetical protein